MTDEQNKPNFWTTLPGILTGIAAILTAIGSVLVVVHPFGSNSNRQDNPAAPAATVPAKSEASARQPPPSTTSSETSHDPQQTRKTIAVITENDGTTLTVGADSLIWFGGTITPREFTLNSGQSVPFDKIKVIDVLAVEDMTTWVQVTLTDDQTFKSSVDGGRVNRGTHFEGKNAGGHVNVPIGIVKQVVIQH